MLLNELRNYYLILFPCESTHLNCYFLERNCKAWNIISFFDSVFIEIQERHTFLEISFFLSDLGKRNDRDPIENFPFKEYKMKWIEHGTICKLSITKYHYIFMFNILVLHVPYIILLLVYFNARHNSKKCEAGKPLYQTKRLRKCEENTYLLTNIAKISMKIGFWENGFHILWECDL